MSFLEHPDLQIWNNAAFDGGDFEDSSEIKAVWTPFKNIVTGVSESIDSDNGKENQSPGIANLSTVSAKPSVPAKPLQAKTKVLEEEMRDEGKIDAEIEEIRSEISRLTSKLDELCLEKARMAAKMVEKRGRIVAAKFMEQKQSVKNVEEARTKVQRRGMSLGPSEIVSGVHRGMSLGPSEISAGGRLRQLYKPDVTPLSTQSRRKSCYWKLAEIDELKVTKERGKSLTVSPKNRKTISKTQPPKQPATTIASKRPVKKQPGIVSSIQPKKLFMEGDKSAKKPVKNGRIVPSRYSLISNQSTGLSSLRKRSLPENEDDGKRSDKRRNSNSSTENPGEALPDNGENLDKGRVKKKWEIPSELSVVQKRMEDEDSSPEILLKIRTDRRTNESPRDSGPAKRVADLIGRKPYFCRDEEDGSVYQALDFAEAENKN